MIYVFYTYDMHGFEEPLFYTEDKKLAKKLSEKIGDIDCHELPEFNEWVEEE